MASKLGTMLSMIIIYIALLFGVDFVSIQLTYTCMDSLSTSVSFKISKSGEINDEVRQFVMDSINGEIEPVGLSYSYEEGSTLGYYLIKRYKFISHESDPLELRIKRYAVINLYKWFYYERRV